MVKYPLIILTLSLVFLHNLNVSLFSSDVKRNPRSLDNNLFSTNQPYSIKDTVYTKHSSYIEVNLTVQRGYFHSRNGLIREFALSSGNEKLKDGVETNEGLFVIQVMLPSWNSEQFDSTLLLNWMGFNHGIGFHAMLSSGYYRYLGKKNLSHGCVRLSRNDAAFVYSKIDKGTPVLVHGGNNIICLAFADTLDNSYNFYSYQELKEIINKRIESIYRGTYFLEFHPKILIDLANVKHDGFSIGNSKKTASLQITYPENNLFAVSVNDNLNARMIFKRSLRSSIVKN